MSNFFKLTCEECGKDFSSAKMQPYCSACRKHVHHRNQRKISEIDRIANEAAKAGMTYGQYVSKYGV